jgi:hypothetical protein
MNSRAVFKDHSLGLVIALAMMLLGAIGVSSGAVAEEDEHDIAPPPVAQPAPRGEARADGIEALAVATPDHKLVIYLDRESSNEPVSGAILEVDAAGMLIKARDIGNGVYVAEDWIVSPGRNLLSIGYQLGGRSGKLAIQIDAPMARSVAQPQPAASRLDVTDMSAIAAAIVIVYLAAMALFLWRARRTPAPAR